MKGIDALIQNPERSLFFCSFSRKIKKTVEILTKLVPKMRQVVQRRAFAYRKNRKSSTQTQMKGINAHIQNPEISSQHD